MGVVAIADRQSAPVDPGAGAVLHRRRAAAGARARAERRWRGRCSRRALSAAAVSQRTARRNAQHLRRARAAARSAVARSAAPGAAAWRRARGARRRRARRRRWGLRARRALRAARAQLALQRAPAAAQRILRPRSCARPAAPTRSAPARCRRPQRAARPAPASSCCLSPSRTEQIELAREVETDEFVLPPGVERLPGLHRGCEPGGASRSRRVTRACGRCQIVELFGQRPGATTAVGSTRTQPWPSSHTSAQACASDWRISR